MVVCRTGVSASVLLVDAASPRSKQAREVYQMSFGERLRFARQQAGRTPAHVADRAGLSQAEYMAYESPENDLQPSYNVLLGMAQALGVSMDSLAGVLDEPIAKVPNSVASLTTDDVSRACAVSALVNGSLLAEKVSGRLSHHQNLPTSYLLSRVYLHALEFVLFTAGLVFNQAWYGHPASESVVERFMSCVERALTPEASVASSPVNRFLSEAMANTLAYIRAYRVSRSVALVAQMCADRIVEGNGEDDWIRSACISCHNSLRTEMISLHRRGTY